MPNVSSRELLDISGVQECAVLFPPPCNGSLQGLHLDSQIEEEERASESAGLKLEEQLLAHPPAKAWQQVPGEALGTWFTQDRHSWPSF
ncbi:unnamed protein product [Rangifer tarandus platyrhynchus]|uniref:Uncharacterized protein n=1 Tax=Rangifer tarandus platyrhynchus TaxID=3082113 RepID=A0AC59ZFQ4_RANTA